MLQFKQEPKEGLEEWKVRQAIEAERVSSREAEQDTRGVLQAALEEHFEGVYGEIVEASAKSSLREPAEENALLEVPATSAAEDLAVVMNTLWETFVILHPGALEKLDSQDMAALELLAKERWHQRLFPDGATETVTPGAELAVQGLADAEHLAGGGALHFPRLELPLHQEVSLGESNNTDTEKGHTAAVYWVASASDGRIVSAGRDNTVRVWSPEGALLRTLPTEEGVEYEFALRSDGLLVAASSTPANLLLWNTAGTREPTIMPWFQANTQNVQLLNPTFLADGKLCYMIGPPKGFGRVGGHDWLHILDIASGESQMIERDMTYSAPTALVALPDGKVAGIVSRYHVGEPKGALSIWDPQTLTSVTSEVGANSDAAYSSITLTPEGSILTGGPSGVREWNPHSKKLRQSAVLGKAEYHGQLATLPSGEIVWSVDEGSRQGIHVADPSGQETKQISLELPTLFASTPEGRLLVAQEDTAVRVLAGRVDQSDFGPDGARWQIPKSGIATREDLVQLLRYITVEISSQPEQAARIELLRTRYTQVFALLYKGRAARYHALKHLAWGWRDEIVKHFKLDLLQASQAPPEDDGRGGLLRGSGPGSPEGGQSAS
jgi:hypothetical protein